MYGLVVVLVVAVMITFAYLLPTVIAWAREHPSGISIAVIDAFLGWTLIGYVIALAWSMSAIRLEDWR